MLSFEDFLNFYKRSGKCVNDFYPRKNSLNEKQLQSKYEKYVKSENKRAEALKWHLEKANQKEILVDESYSMIREEVLNEKGNECMLLALLKYLKKYNDIQLLKNNSNGLHKQIDVAHVFSRGSCPHLKYDKDNLVPLNRFSHSMLDQFRDPITGEQIDKYEHEIWWKIILGSEKYLVLKEKANAG